MTRFVISEGLTWRCSLSSCSLLLLLGGCNSTGVGNPAPALSFSLAIVNDESPLEDPSEAGMGGALAEPATASAGTFGEAGAAGAPSAVVQPGLTSSDAILPLRAVKDAVVVFGELRFLPCDPSSGDVFRVPGPFIVDLKKKTTTPDIPGIADTPGGYCGIDAPLAPAMAPASLAGRSVFFDGYRADGTFFIVYANMTATLRMRAKPGATWMGQEPPPLFFWALRPRRWLMPLELNMVEPMPYDDHLRAVVIDAEHHPGLFSAIRRRLAGVSTLYADANGDGVFDDPDRAAEVGEGLENAD
ncbi:MAG TPA: hypothetical protein VHW01_24385 [Polyangiaceae bacterium]|nr:hypothetical protein [Polyangiaceae bacterium]